MDLYIVSCWFIRPVVFHVIRFEDLDLKIVEVSIKVKLLYNVTSSAEE